MEFLNAKGIQEILLSTVDNSIQNWNQLPNPYQMKNMDLAVKRFLKAVQQNEKILFIHDSDADGLGTYMLSHIFFSHFFYKII